MWSSPLSKSTLGGLLSSGCRGLPGSEVFGAQQETTDLHLGRELKKDWSFTYTSFYVSRVLCDMWRCTQ